MEFVKLRKIIFFMLIILSFVLIEKGITSEGRYILEKKFLPLQQEDKYYKDKRCRYPYRFWEAKKIKAYKANFGKKIWVKSWKEADFKKFLPLFGNIERKMEFWINAIEISKKVSPFVNKEIEKLISGKKISESDWKKWLEKFEDWGRTYFILRNMGKAKNHFIIIDGENGNCICLNGKMFFIEEGRQKVIDILFECPYLLKKSHREKKK